VSNISHTHLLSHASVILLERTSFVALVGFDGTVLVSLNAQADMGNFELKYFSSWTKIKNLVHRILGNELLYPKHKLFSF